MKQAILGFIPLPFSVVRFPLQKEKLLGISDYPSKRSDGKSLMKKTEDLITDAKSALPDVTPTPPGFKQQSSPKDLKSRLEWGEPALTILDARDRESFNKGHIMGAMPLETIVEQPNPSLAPQRDIYVYGGSDAETAEVAARLRSEGFRNVAEIQGGLEGWKAISGPTEGTEEIVHPGPDAYNVMSRIAQHQQSQKRR